MDSRPRVRLGALTTSRHSRSQPAASSTHRATHTTRLRGCGTTASSIPRRPGTCSRWVFPLRPTHPYRARASACFACERRPMNQALLEIERHGCIATIWLNRPHVHNAFDEHLIAALTGTLATLDGDGGVRV